MTVLMVAGIDDVVLNFSPLGLQILNAILAVVMFSIAIDLSVADFKRLFSAPKPLITGLASQFLLLPALTFVMILLINPQPSIALGLMLVLPLCLGVMLNARRPDITARIRTPLQYLSMGIFVAFIVIALAANWELFLQYAGVVAGMVLLHNALAFAGGFSLASLVGLSEFDRRAVTIETGIQNSGLGLILIFGFFSGLGAMAVVAAFWGIWHLLSGITLETLFARRGLAEA